MEQYQKALQGYLDSVARKAIFAAFSPLRSAKNEDEQTFSDFIINIRESDIFIEMKAAGVPAEELQNMIYASFEQNSKELLEKIATGIKLAVDETKKFERKKKEDKKEH